MFFHDGDLAVIAEKSAPTKEESERKEVAEAFRMCASSIVDELVGAINAELQRRKHWSTGAFDTNQSNETTPAAKDKGKTRAREETPERDDPLFAAPEFSPQNKKQKNTAGSLFVDQLSKEKSAEEGE